MVGGSGAMAGLSHMTRWVCSRRLYSFSVWDQEYFSSLQILQICLTAENMSKTLLFLYFFTAQLVCDSLND